MQYLTIWYVTVYICEPCTLECNSVLCETCTVWSSVIVNSALSRMIHAVMPCAKLIESRTLFCVALVASVVYCMAPGTLLQVQVELLQTIHTREISS